MSRASASFLLLITLGFIASSLGFSLHMAAAPTSDLADMLGFVASREFSETLDVALTKPRLPVMNPCL